MTDQQNSLMCRAERIKDELRHHFSHFTIGCPYDLPYQATYNQALFDTMPDFLMDVYLAAGYRRNGNVIYDMHCRDCQACTPIRLDPQEFEPNRSQKRVWRKNRDLTVEISPLACSRENLELLGKFLQNRFPGRDGSPLDYYTGFFLNHITNTVEFRYREGPNLIGTAIVDLSSTWLNVVFFYFDPDVAGRSPGTYNILYLIDFCMQKGIKFIYLGYWIKNVKAMSYKEKFKPHYIFCNNEWVKVKR